MREITCPGCGEVLGVPAELGGGAIRCGVCERIIDPGEQRAARPTAAREDRSEDRGDEDRPRRARRRVADEDYDRPKKKSGCGMWAVILGIGGVIALVCCGGGGFVIFKLIDPKWEKFTPPDARWSADYPGQPKMESKPIEGVAGAGNATFYTAERLLGREAYLVGYGELSAADLRFVVNDRILNDGLDGIAKGPLTVREVSRRNLKMVCVEAKEATLDVTDPKLGSGRMVVRMLIADNRIYTLIAVKMGQGVANPEHLDKFFNSFVLTPKK